MNRQKTLDELIIGSIALREGYGGPGTIQIRRASGPNMDEAGDFSVGEIESILLKYYEEHF